MRQMDPVRVLSGQPRARTSAPGFTPAQTDCPRDELNITDYYDQTWLDYRLLWMGRQSRSLHFGYWDRQTHGHTDSLLRMNAVLADAVGIQPEELVLDAGCGIGGTAVWLASERAARVIGVTLSAQQADRARRYAHASGLDERCRFSQQDFRRLAFSDGRFDVVWAHESMCHARDKESVLAEAWRVLRPGGALVCADGFRTRRPHPAPDERHLAAWLREWAVPDLATTGEFVRWAERAGFRDLLVRDLSRHVRRSLLRLRRLGVTLFVPASLLYGLGLRSRVQQGNVRGSYLAWQTFRRGLWRYALVVARKPERPQP
jgi:tocopherol O-methyltransferase